VLDALLRPVGHLPAAVYWRRRLLVLGGAVLIVVVIALLAGGSSSPHHPASPSASPSAGSPTQAVNDICTASQLSLTVTTDSQSYGPGVSPHADVTVHNHGKACSAPKGLVLVITSGPARIWGNTDCAAATPLHVPAGTTSMLASWALERSKPGCGAPNGAATAAAGTYHLVATLAGATGATSFQLL
jgi:hypothetical protein